MRIRAMKRLQLATFFALCLIPSIFSPTEALSEESYVFERMWPTLQQPWYFNNLPDIEVDSRGYLYVSETGGHRICVLNSDGHFITDWGSEGSGDGQLHYPAGIAFDSYGNVYVADEQNHRIQKFTPDGRFITKWGSFGSGDGQFNGPTGIAMDQSDNIYVADRGNHRIQKLTLGGEFITKWGSYGSNNGELMYPAYIAIDSEGNIYVGEKGEGEGVRWVCNHRIQKFTSSGQYITKWGTEGEGEGEFYNPAGIAIDQNDYVYVAEKWNDSINKFSSDGQLIFKIGTPVGYGISIDGKGHIYTSDFNDVRKFTMDVQLLSIWGADAVMGAEYSMPIGIALDSSGNIYIAEYNNRVLMWSPEDELMTEWNIHSGGSGTYPYGIALNTNSDIYVSVTDFNGEHYIRRLSPDGQSITWGSYGSGDGQFKEPKGLDIDENGNVYVADSGNNRIQKFNSGGQLLLKLGRLGTGNGEFAGPSDLVIDPNGYLYVADTGNCRIQKFTLDGIFVGGWGNQGIGDGELDSPVGIAVDQLRNVYIIDGSNHRIQKFTSEGQFITKWGGFGTAPGQMRYPIGIAVSPDGSKVYITEWGNNRRQVFCKLTFDTSTKAIVVAGGGPFPGNNLWAATEMCANFAYRTLNYQGFSKNNIYYLSSDTDLDLDLNGEFDDVDGDATKSNLQQAITDWATDAEEVVVYLVDHGGNGNFRMSGTETLSAGELDSWLDALQDSLTGTLIVIYDACESGSFVGSLSASGRIVITSTSPGESATFISQGSISFSNFFWTHVFNGVTVKNAFELAKESLSYTTAFQHPLLDDNGNGAGNDSGDGDLAKVSYIGNGTEIHGDAPVIGSVSPEQSIDGTNSALLYAENVIDTDGIARVWAEIRPPNYSQASSDNPVQAFPTVDLMPVEGDRYEVTYEGFCTAGTYLVTLYARDRIGNTSIPKLTTVEVHNPLSNKALIVAGGSSSDDLWPAIERNITLASQALGFQGFTGGDQYVLSPAEIEGIEVDDSATLDKVEHALTSWAPSNTHDVVVYLVGNGGEGSFQINDSESLSASSLDSWLDTLQGQITGKVIVVYDACQSGSFLPALKPPTGKSRILIASTEADAPACFLSQGYLSFSNFFWRRIANGATIRDAFDYASEVITHSYEGQVPLLDDNGNGIGNEEGEDGRLARAYAIGAGIMLAGDDPLIGSIAPEQTITGQSSAVIWVEEVTTTGTIDKVWAVITPPELSSSDASNPVTDLPTLELNSVGDNKYEGTYTEFTSLGTYKIAVYARDDEGTVSSPKETTVNQTIASDGGGAGGGGGCFISETKR